MKVVPGGAEGNATTCNATPKRISNPTSHHALLRLLSALMQPFHPSNPDF
jgi:hypothetical protein